MSRSGIAFLLTIIIVVFILWNLAKSNEERQIDNTNSLGRDKYGLLASDYDINGWAKVNGKWVSNPREGALIKYSSQGIAGVTKTISTSGLYQNFTSAAVNTPTVRNGTTYALIDATLRKVAVDYKAKADVNKDGKTNCIDAAVLFYQYFPEKEYVCIELNYNEHTGLNHLFNCVFIDGVWRAIEPQTFAVGRSSYWMSDVWGYQYDPSFNKDDTLNYLQYVK